MNEPTGTDPSLWLPDEAPRPEAFAKPRRSWGKKFGDAFRGMKWGVRGHSSFFVHFFFAVLVALAGMILQCDLVDWCLLILCIGSVMAAELFNSALETLFRGLDEETKSRSWQALDIAAGAVLMMSIAAALVGVLVLGNRLIELLKIG